MEHIQQGDEVGSLNMQDTPQDASATMCLVVQSSDLEEQETVTQFYGHHWEQRDRVREQQKEQGGHHQVIQGCKQLIMEQDDGQQLLLNQHELLQQSLKN